MFCKNCGSQIPDGLNYCPTCGTVSNLQSQQPQQNYQQPQQNYQQPQQGYQQPQQSYQQPQQGYQQPQQGYQQPYQGYQPQQGYQQPYQAYQPQPAAQYEQPMNWFKFLIYFAFFAGAVVSVIDAIRLFTGSIYGENVDLIYSIFDGLQAVNIISGILYLGLAALMIVTRFKLSGFKADGPKFVMITYASSAAVSVFLLAGTLIVLGDYATGESVSELISSGVGTVIGSIVMILVNKVYFDKRKHLFVN